MTEFNKNNIKICFVLDTLHYGGAVKLTLDLIGLLKSEGFDIAIVSLIGEEINKDLYKNIIPEDTKIYFININKINFFLRIKVLNNIFQKYDIIHSCLEMANFYTGLVSLISKNKIYLSSIHARDGIYIEDENVKKIFKQKKFRRYVIFVKYIQSYLFKHFNLIIALNNDAKIFLESVRHIKTSKIKMIYYGYLFNNLKKECNGSELHELKSRLGINDTDYIIGYVGRITYGKGLEKSLDIIIELIRENPSIKFIMVGDGELTENLQEIIDTNSVNRNIIIEGYSEEIEKYYLLFDLLILPSMSEGIPLVILEGMYLGVPVFTSDAGGLPEIVKNGITGITFKKGDFIQMKSLLSDIINKKIKTEKLVENAKTLIMNEFNLSLNYKKISQELKRLYLLKR